MRCTGGKAAARAGACHGTSGREDTSPGAAVQGHPVNTDTSDNTTHSIHEGNRTQKESDDKKGNLLSFMYSYFVSFNVILSM